MVEPADKKRKIDDDDWDDDDFAFTQEQLNDLDMVTMSQISSHKESSSSSSCSRSRSTFQIGTAHQFVKPKVNNSPAKASLNKRDLKSPFENTDSNHVKVNSPTSFNESSSSKFPSNNKDLSQADSPNNFNKSLITKNETLQGQVSKYKNELKKGDLFGCSINECLAHCISADIKMGKGIAVLFKNKFGGVDDLLRQGKKTGDCAVLKRGNKHVYYLVTKDKYWQKPTYDSLKLSLMAMKNHCVQNNVQSVSMPKIGCGLDGLNWDSVTTIMKDVFCETDLKITVYVL